MLWCRHREFPIHLYLLDRLAGFFSGCPRSFLKKDELRVTVWFSRLAVIIEWSMSVTVYERLSLKLDNLFFFFSTSPMCRSGGMALRLVSAYASFWTWLWRLAGVYRSRRLINCRLSSLAASYGQRLVLKAIWRLTSVVSLCMLSIRQSCKIVGLARKSYSEA